MEMMLGVMSVSGCRSDIQFWCSQWYYAFVVYLDGAAVWSELQCERIQLKDYRCSRVAGARKVTGCRSKHCV